MSSAHRLFTIEAARQPDAYVIRVEGELDRAGRPELESVLASAEMSQTDRIDLTLPFTDPVDARAASATRERVGS